MQVTRSNFHEALGDIKQHISSAKFMAIDMEFTGVKVGNEPDMYFDTVEERLNKSCRVAECYAPVEFGLSFPCPAGDGFTGDTFRSYNIRIGPRSSFACDKPALKFLCKQGFDLNQWIDEGVPIPKHKVEHVEDECTEGDSFPLPLAGEHPSVGAALLKLQMAARDTTFICQAWSMHRERKNGFDFNKWVDQIDFDLDDRAQFMRMGSPLEGAIEEDDTCEGLPELWQLIRGAIRDHNIRVVVHGHVDVLFLLTLFEQPTLPRDSARLAQLIKTCFPGGITDTALLRDKVPNLRLCKPSLGGFFDDVVRDRRWIAHALPLETQATYGKLLMQGTNAAEHRHEAGFDALKTALLYSQLGYNDEKIFDSHVDLLSLYKNTECIDINSAVAGNSPCTGLFAAQGLKVAVLMDEDAKKTTHHRITEFRKVNREYTFFYRWIDDNHLLVPDCPDSLLAPITENFPGVQWSTFSQWQRNQRSNSGRSDRRYTGEVKKLGARHAFGFINCHAAAQLSRGGGDVFLTSDQIGTLQVGDNVTFTAMENEKGQVLARDLKVTGACFTGVIKHFKEDTSNTVGYGFICSPEAHRLFGRDVFLARQQLNGCKVGDSVSFCIDMNDKGQPKARGLSKIVEVDTCIGTLCGESASTTQVGRVKRYSMTSSYGFISCDAVNEDVYVSSTNLDGCAFLHVGEYVEFELVFNESGKPQAKNVFCLNVLRASVPIASPEEDYAESESPEGDDSGNAALEGPLPDDCNAPPSAAKGKSALTWLGGWAVPEEDTDEEDESTAGLVSADFSSGDSDVMDAEKVQTIESLDILMMDEEKVLSIESLDGPLDAIA